MRIVRSLAVGCLAGAAVLLPPSVQAQTLTDREQRLLDRIQQLERRLEQLERRVPTNTARRERRTEARVRGGPSTTTPGEQGEPAASTPAATVGAAARARAPQDEDIPQEAFVFREQAVTLQPGRVEVGLEATYTRDRRQVTEDRMARGTLSVRAGVIQGVEVAVSVPYLYSQRSFTVGPNDVVNYPNSSWGDVSVQANVALWRETAALPGAVFTAGVVLPTGAHPYVVPASGLNAQQQPIDVLRFHGSRGHWGVRSGLQFFKTVDPLLLFGGFAIEHAFGREIGGITFRPGLRYHYNFGVSFAVSDRTTLGATLTGTYAEALRANEFTYRASATESHALRFSLIQRVGTATWLEPSLTLGLVPETPAFQGGLALRHRF